MFSDVALLVTAALSSCRLCGVLTMCKRSGSDANDFILVWLSCLQIILDGHRTGGGEPCLSHCSIWVVG